MAGGDDEWAVIPPEPDGEPAVPRANNEPALNRLGCPINRCHGPKRPTWGENGPELTNMEKTELIHEYERDRAHDVRGMTASGLAVFIRERNVCMDSRKGYLGTVFLNGTAFKISANGTAIVRR